MSKRKLFLIGMHLDEYLIRCPIGDNFEEWWNDHSIEREDLEHPKNWDENDGHSKTEVQKKIG